MFDFSLRILELIVRVKILVEEITLSEFILVFRINHHSSISPCVLIRSVTPQLQQYYTLKQTVA